MRQSGRAHERAAEFDRGRAQPGQVELLVAVQAADAARALARVSTRWVPITGPASLHQPVRARAAVRRTDRTVDVVTGRRAGWHAQARTHLFGEDKMSQALRRKNLVFVFVARPGHIEARRITSVVDRARVGR